MATLNIEITDDEERALAFLVESKMDTLRALRLVTHAKRKRDEEVLGVYDDIAYEEVKLAGYQLALANRRLHLRDGARK
jgi:hypothetical protein